MLKIALVLLVIGLACVFFLTMGSSPPLRGLTHLPGSPQPLLLARARPAITFTLDPSLAPLAAGWRDIRPATRESLDGDARIWLALYSHAKGLLVTAIADSRDRWEWDAGHHAPFPTLREQKLPGHDIYSVFETLYVLEHRQDPFCGRAPTGKATRELGACLVYRAKMILEFNKCQVIVEYHEDLPDELALDIAHANDYLNNFTHRARAAGQFRILTKADGSTLAADIEKVGSLDKSISRRTLARWVGEMHRKGHV